MRNQKFYGHVFLYLVVILLVVSQSSNESFGTKERSSWKHWTDSDLQEGLTLREEPDFGLLSPGARWDTSLSRVPTAIAYHSAVAVEVAPGDWKVYVFGGYNGSSFVNTTYEYDVSSGSWTTKASMPGGPRGRLASALVKGKIYVVGGTSDFYNALNLCEEYDPLADTWIQKADMPTARQFLSAVSWRDTLLYAIGGDGGVGNSPYLKKVEVYDPMTNVWMTADSVLTPRRSHASGILGDEIFVAMGWKGEYLQTMEKGLIQDTMPTRIIWTQVEDAPYEASRIAGAAFLGEFYITGGDSVGTLTEKTYKYNLATENWSLVPDKIIAVSNTQAFVGIDPETLLLYPGGWGSSGVTNINEGFPLAIHDVEALSIVLPDTILLDSAVTLTAIVENSGIVMESFDAELLIFVKGGDTVYGDTLLYPNLAPGDTAVFPFPAWIVTLPVDTIYEASLCTQLGIDGNPSNDCTSNTSRAFSVHDVKAISIDVPQNTIYLDSTITPQVTVKNAGLSTETFVSELLILYAVGGDTVYRDTLTVSNLLPDSTAVLNFPTTWAITVDTPYVASLCTDLGIDPNPFNDCISKSPTLRVRDVAVISILQPPDTFYTDSTYTPKVRVQNLGYVSENFAVSFTVYDTSIAPIYSETTQVSSLAPGATRDTTFSPDWTVPSWDTIYTIISCTHLSADDRIFNDCLQRTFDPLLSVGISEEEFTDRSFSFHLFEGRPNPFNRWIHIHFSHSSKSLVSLKIYDLSGRPIRDLLEKTLEEGDHTISWDGLDDAGRKVPSGVYFSRLEMDGRRFVRKMILIQ